MLEFSLRSQIQAAARRRLDSLTSPTLDLLIQLNPTFVRPTHLEPMAALYERAWRAPTFGTIHAPPQHGKTKLTETFIINTLLRGPFRIVYATYEAHRAWRVSASIRKRGLEAGLLLDESVRAKDAWQTVGGGQLVATGVGGPLTGEPADIVLIDDPYKNRKQALSARYKQEVEDWFFDVVESRTHKGSSIFVHHTRWHSDDLIGWIQESDDYDYEEIRLPAILEDGESILWPHRFTLELLEKRRRANPDNFEGLYQGKPPLSRGKIFTLATLCDSDYPRQGRVSIGMDGAYSEKKRADSCAVVVLREVWEFDAESGVRRKHFVVEHARKDRAPIEEFKPVLKNVQRKYPGTRIRWSGAGAEAGIAANLRESGIRVDFETALSDKVARAANVAEAWRLGDVRVPEDAEWAEDFIDEVTSFTGVEGRPDDYVDALSDAFVGMTGSGLSSYTDWIENA